MSDNVRVSGGTCNNPDHDSLRNELAELKSQLEFKELQFKENFELAKRRFNEAKDSALVQRDKANAFEQKLKVAQKAHG